MPAYVLVEIAVTDPQAYERYKALAEVSVAAHGGRYLVRGGRREQLEGSRTPARLVLLEFPSMERARAWWSSPEYEAAKPFRLDSTSGTEMLLLEGYTPTGP
jgi:uncharacterized protein (DUF1330 family)